MFGRSFSVLFIEVLRFWGLLKMSCIISVFTVFFSIKLVFIYIIFKINIKMYMYHFNSNLG